MAGLHRRTRAPDASAPTAAHPRGGARRACALVAHHRKISALVLALFLVVIGTAVALGPQGGPFTNQTPATFEGLAKVGPTDPQLHFPAWYRDHQATALEACVDPKDANCLAPVGKNFDPAKPLSLDSTTPALNNFPDEFFYFDSTSVLTDAAPAANVPTRLLVENNLEGAFANGAPALGDQMVFSRFRVKVDAGLQPNTTYTIVHPYGTADVHTGAGETGFFVTQDIPLAALDFSGALHSRLGPFLTWAPNPTDPADVPPAGYLGDPRIQHTISNSPVDNNYVALLGPGVGAGAPAANQCPPAVLGKFDVVANNCLYNDQFSLMGKKATRSGVDVTRSTYTRAADGTTRLEVLAESNAGQNILARDPDAALRVTPQRRLSATPLTDGGNGLYFAHILANPANVNQLPDKVEVVNQTDVPPTIKDVALIDAVSGTAIYDGSTTGPNLHVVAKSSDQLGGTTPVAALSVPTDAAGNPLTDTGSTIAQALTPQADGTQTWDFTVKAPPATVLVLSKQGGTVALPVDVSTAPDNPAGPLTAVAGADQSIADGPLEPASVSLNGSASTGDIASYDWTGPYAVDAGGALTGAPDPALGAAPNKVATGLYDATVAPPTAVGTYGYRLTVTDGAAPPNANADDMVLTVTAGPTAASEIITPVRQAYRADQTRWQIDGTDNVIAGNSITAHNGSSPRGVVIGTSPIGTTGAYTIDTRTSGIVPELCTGDPANATNACVTLVSKLGNSVTLVVAPLRGAAPAPPAPVAAAPVPAPAPAIAPAPVAPLALGAARVAAVPAFAAAALVGAGVPLTVTVPARARVLRIRVLTIPGKFRAASVGAGTTGRPELLRVFHTVTISSRTRTIRFRLRSRKLHASVRRGHSYTLEITPGLARTRLGKPTRTTLHVR